MFSKEKVYNSVARSVKSNHKRLVYLIFLKKEDKIQI